MILSIIIPVFNEEGTIIDVLNKVKNHLENKIIHYNKNKE